MSKLKVNYQSSFSELLAADERTHPVTIFKAEAGKAKRIESIDLLRGIVMIIMALDHVRDYFHHDAFLYDPADFTRTSAGLFFTRFITHYCAPVFVFLAGISAYLYGAKKSKGELSFYLFTRGLWLVFIELFILSLFKTFNPFYTYVNLQVIWAIGICMMALSAIIYMPKQFMFFTGAIIVACHNMLDGIHIPGNNLLAFFWSVLHEPNYFTLGSHYIHVFYPVLPWLGIMCLGYYAGNLYVPGYDPVKRKRILLSTGIGAIALFILLRSGNWYGDAATWSVQKNTMFSLLSFLKVTKYPPSLLYILITLGPALIFLAFAEKPLNALTRKIVIFGRVPMFYYLLHFLLIHTLASIAALLTGYPAMVVLSNTVDAIPGLKGYGFSLITVYAVWIALILMLYPFCKWFERYKREHQFEKQWLSYL
jgi:uncharacterized membrane protein